MQQAKYYNNINICISIGYKRPTHRDLYKYVVPKYAHEWRFLGTLLKFDQAHLDIIYSDYRNDSKECCRRLLSTWLEKFPDALWDQLLSAIDDVAYQGMILIGVSLRKHCTYN